MIEPYASSPPPARRAGHAIRYGACALGAGFAMLAWSCVAPLVRAVSWIRQRRAAAEPHGVGARLAAILPDASNAPAPGAERTTARRGFAIRATPVADVVEVAADLDARHHTRLFAALQRPRAKLLDLRPATRIASSLFERLADGWRAGPDTVPRLAIVLDYERWVVFRTVAERRLRPIVARGVGVEVFYDQQLASVPAWLETGSIIHDVPAVLAWLRTGWLRTPVWRTVLHTTAMLVHADAPEEQVPDLLLELVAIALSFDGPDGPDGIEQALTHAESALRWTGKTPSAARCRALRAKATVLRRRGDRIAALAELDTALSVAMIVGDRVEEASTFVEIGLQALREGHAARAETRFRTALAVLSNAQDDAPFLRATLHHQLAVSLCAQQRYDEAEQHAGAALALRWSRDSALASEDRALLDQIRMRRPSSSAAPRTETDQR